MALHYAHPVLPADLFHEVETIGVPVGGLLAFVPAARGVTAPAGACHA